jgi:uncharacterized membrane protein
MKMNEIKIYGIIGASLMAFGILPQIGILFVVLGLLFLLLATYRYSKIFDSPKVFDYFLIGTVLLIIANILFYLKIMAFLISFFIGLLSNNPIIPITFSLVIYMLVFYILNIAAMVNYSKSFKIIYSAHKNGFFRFAGGFLIWGSVLNILAIGLILQEIGWILAILGFFTLENIYEAEIIEPEKIEKKN